MLRDKDGHLSSTKVMSFVGFIAFIFTSIYVLCVCPEKFNYELFSILAGGGAVGTRVIDKWLNIRAQGGRK
mgnify:CR=1 FL=1